MEAMNRRIRGIAFVLGVVAGLLMSAAAAFAAGPYEPNENIPAAAGPLTLGATYGGAVETAADLDFFYFYVTGTTGSTVSLMIVNQGGGERGAELDARLIDAYGISLGEDIAYLRKGESRTETLTLPPGKYFVEVAANEGSGDSYLLTPGGSAGAFGSYSQIVGHCAAATRKTEGLQAALTRAEGALQRARSKFRRSRFSGREARRRTHARLVTIERQVVAKKAALRKAKQSPWCGIPQ
jgi:hypothetical protein